MDQCNLVEKGNLRSRARCDTCTSDGCFPAPGGARRGGEKGRTGNTGRGRGRTREHRTRDGAGTRIGTAGPLALLGSAALALLLAL